MIPVSRSPLNQIIGATVLLLTAGVLFIPAYFYWNGSIQRSMAALPKCGAAPRFESCDQAGQPVGAAELSGTFWVAGFVDVANPGDAELLCSKFAELDQNFRGAKAVTLVSFFVGAEKSGLKDYARRYEASDRWHLASIERGNSSILLQAWSSAIKGCFGESRIEDLLLLIDRQGQIRGVYDAAEPEVVQKILTDAGNLLRVKESPLSTP